MTSSQVLAEVNSTMKTTEATTQAFENIVRTRRSIRVFECHAIPETIMRRCLDLTLLAPNSSNLQPWEFYWVRDEAKKEQLAKCCLGQPAAVTAAEMVVCVARRDTWKRNRKWMLELLDQANASNPVPASAKRYYKTLVPLACGQGPGYLLGPFKKLVMNLIGLRKPSPRGPAGKSDMRVWAHKTTALACQNLMLSLRAYGYDSCPMEGFDGARVKRLLSLPRGAEICMVISAGKRSEKGVYGKQVRFPKKHFVFEV
ncbi:MAG: nitroreductase family protein [Pirellulaceae bacterium]|nr:nitroreductase family protein [Pirellulaceae bacterium]